jgi:nitric oxide dioxygenase
MALRPSTVKIIKATAPVLAEHGYAITSTMYGRMLPNNPKVSELFNPTHQVKLPGDSVARQPLALAQSVLAYAQNIDNLGALGPAVERIAHKHVALHILPEHYPVVGENLLWAIKEVLGDAATPDIMEAWGEGYQLLADIFIDRERELREGKGKQPGGWEGWREFVVTKKTAESSEAMSFHLKPKDGKGILSFLPGQYIGIRVELPHMTTQRNYSLSNAPNMGEYRITVKKEGPAMTGCPMGKVSSYLHDEIKEGDVLKLTVPSGDFFLEVDHDKPIVLLSGGVGITPVASMAQFLANKNLPNNVTMVNCNRCPQSAALGAELHQLVGGRDNFKVKTIFDSSSLGDAKGFLTKDILASYVGANATDSHYYFCGPPAFMVNVRHILGEMGVPAEQIHYEFFGPHDSN